ncbi:AMP-binding protein [Azospirillum agricola]|uniref:AMP-binding protein n=1 Tax=Azospirillum agricola TaxID=1720247 RepID=UPI000A0F3CD2|nr:AMP-binding protein [Azospirillum agricola]SMH61923.1 malonyl-CoA/methylmalonyl-CoA synthetase [Azospirillum lipoferum]
MMTENLYSLLLPSDPRDDARPALQTGTGAAWSYGDLRRTAGRIARLLHESGVGRGDRVAAQVEKSPEALCLYLATLQIGAVYLPLNTAYTLTELRYFLGDAEPAVFVGPPQSAAEVAALDPAPAGCLFTLDGDGGGSLTAACRDLDPWDGAADMAADDVAAILYTSGTTGRPKGAMITHGNLGYTTRTLAGLWGIADTDVLLHALPVFHAHGLFIAANPVLFARGSMLFLSRFSADRVIELLPRATLFMGVPTLYTRLLADPRLTPDLCRGMRLFTCGSAPLSAETFARFEECSGHRILERYGMTETAIITTNPLDGERVPGTVGFPLPGLEVRVADEGGRPLPPGGEIGGLELRGPNVFKGYWRMPEKTAAEFRPDGFFITGDLARRAADGRISIVSRAKDLIISGGYNVYPREVESVLGRIEGVRDAAVIGVPHPDFGEGVVAVIERQPDAPPPDPAVVIAQAARELAGYKLPKIVVVQEALPRNAMGKVQKNELRAQHKDVFTLPAPAAPRG